MKIIDRHVKYNFRRSEDHKNCNTWYFLLVNGNREIEQIKKKIYTTFAPIQNEESLPPQYQGRIKRSGGLGFELLVFDSGKTVDLSSLRGISRKIGQDRELYRREEPHGLEDYLDKMFNK